VAIAPAHAQSDDGFYKGKRIQLIVGWPSGSGYDLYARVLSNYFGRHLAGAPTVIMENMPGAGSLTAANYLYERAPRDGTSIGALSRGIAVAPLMQTVAPQNIRFDPLEFTWIGSMAREVTIGFVWAGKGIESFDDVLHRQILVGTAAVTTDGFVLGNMLNNLVGTKLRIITGYRGSNEIYLAVERGELQGYFGGTLSSLMTTQPHWLREKKIKVLIQIALDKDPELPDVPLVGEFVKTQEQRDALKLILAPQAFGRPYVAPPKLPAERAAALRAAFDATMKDPDFLADAKKAQLGISPMTGAELAQLLRQLYASPQTAILAARKATEIPKTVEKVKQ
jgi:tripartite-type tricarboxylate transporter receptor subunit TctC